MIVGKILANAEVSGAGWPLTPPVATVKGDLLVCPANTQYDQIEIYITQQSSTSQQVVVALIPSATSGDYSTEHIIFQELTMPLYAMRQIKGIKMNAGDRIQILGSVGNVNFVVTGLEIT